MFSSKFIVSNKKRIIAVASIKVEGQKEPTDYKIHQITIPRIHQNSAEANDAWTLEVIIVESSLENMLERF